MCNGGELYVLLLLTISVLGNVYTTVPQMTSFFFESQYYSNRLQSMKGGGEDTKVTKKKKESKGGLHGSIKEQKYSKEQKCSAYATQSGNCASIKQAFPQLNSLEMLSVGLKIAFKLPIDITKVVTESNHS